jgi:hypothetical protein
MRLLNTAQKQAEEEREIQRTRLLNSRRRRKTGAVAVFSLPSPASGIPKKPPKYLGR